MVPVIFSGFGRIADFSQKRIDVTPELSFPNSSIGEPDSLSEPLGY